MGSFATACSAADAECDADYTTALTRCDRLLGDQICSSECSDVVTLVSNSGNQYAGAPIETPETYQKTTTYLTGCSCNGKTFPVYQMSSDTYTADEWVMNHKFLFFSCSTGKWGTTVENG